MEIGTGIAVAGIWLGVGMVGIKNGDAAAIASLFGMITTIAVVLGS